MVCCGDFLLLSCLVGVWYVAFLLLSEAMWFVTQSWRQLGVPYKQTKSRTQITFQKKLFLFPVPANHVSLLDNNHNGRIEGIAGVTMLTHRSNHLFLLYFNRILTYFFRNFRNAGNYSVVFVELMKIFAFFWIKNNNSLFYNIFLFFQRNFQKKYNRNAMFIMKIPGKYFITIFQQVKITNN